MKTSPSQFEVMVDFMERNGDLNKPTDGPSGRLRAIAMWQKLTSALNLYTTGTAKPVEKWKKLLKTNRPGESGQSIPQSFEEEMVEASVTSSTTHHALSPQRHTGARRAIRRRLLRSPAPAPPHCARRAPRRHNIAEQFLNSDEHWRNLATQFVTENLRLRELQQQTQWQTLLAKLNDMVKII